MKYGRPKRTAKEERIRSLPASTGAYIEAMFFTEGGGSVPGLQELTAYDLSEEAIRRP